MIDYKILDESINYYSEFGFQRIELPWTVTQAISDITKPKDVEDVFYIPAKKKTLVGSGEQGFLYLYNKGFLPKGRFQGITPCFREDIFDFLHTKYFVKNELIDTLNVSEGNLSKIALISLDFFRKYLPESIIKVTGDGYDIEWEGNELGSYGIRKCDFLTWIYATGAAEPRLSNLISLRNGTRS
jgi:hypothetical protein